MGQQLGGKFLYWNTFEVFRNLFPENRTTVFEIPYIAKSEKLLFWFLSALIAFIIAYIFSIMRTGFLMANTCVHK